MRWSPGRRERPKGMPQSKASDTSGMAVAPVAIMLTAIADMLQGLAQVAVGARSPIPGSAAHLARLRSGGCLRLSTLGSGEHSSFTQGVGELFGCAGQGRVDAFFPSGGQIDGRANINLVGLGDLDGDPCAQTRFPGSFGSAYLYFVVPRVILFHLEHSPRACVDKVDFVSRPGRPYALVTGRCVFTFDRTHAGFTFASTHAGVSTADGRAPTAFADHEPADVPTHCPARKIWRCCEPSLPSWSAKPIQPSPPGFGAAAAWPAAPSDAAAVLWDAPKGPRWRPHR
jgi:glutaconate CoA-transferase, subunit B